MSYTIKSVEGHGDDLLVVVAEDEDGNEVTAVGWVSATTNYYTPDQYGEDGHRIEKASPRTMTSAEVTEYAQQLLAEQNAPTPVVEPVPIAFA